MSGWGEVAVLRKPLSLVSCVRMFECGNGEQSDVHDDYQESEDEETSEEDGDRDVLGGYFVA